MHKNNNLENSQLNISSSVINNASNPRENRDKILLKPIDLTKKIKNMIDNLQKISVPVVGPDFFSKSKNRKLTKIIHPSEISKHKHILRSMNLKKTFSQDKEKTMENFPKTNVNFNLSSLKEKKKKLSPFESEKLIEEQERIENNSELKIKPLYQNGFYLTPHNSSIKNSTQYNTKDKLKYNTGINFMKTAFQLSKNGSKNKNETDFIQNRLMNSNLTQRNFINAKKYFTGKKKITDANFDLPYLSPQLEAGFSKTNNQSIYNKNFSSTTSKADASTHFSDFFKLTNAIGDKSTATSRFLNLDTTKIDRTSKINKSNLGYDNKVISSSQKHSSFELNPLSTDEKEFKLKNRNNFKEFLKTCEKEKEISQYAFDVMGKFFETSYPDRPIREKLSPEQLEKDDMFRLQNFAKNYFLLFGEKGIFISEDYGVNEVLGFTRKITRIHSDGSYKFRKIIGERIGLNVLQEGNQLRLTTLKQPPDLILMNRNKKFLKQHEEIVNKIENINSKKKFLKKREKDYLWNQNFSPNFNL